MRKQILEINEKLRIRAIEEKEAQRLLLILFSVSESLIIGMFKLQKATEVNSIDRRNILWLEKTTNGEGTDIDLEKVFESEM